MQKSRTKIWEYELFCNKTATQFFSSYIVLKKLLSAVSVYYVPLHILYSVLCLIFYKCCIHFSLL